MTTTRLSILVTVLVLTTGVWAQQGQSADVLLQAAMHRELVEGNLPAAIADYKAILSRFPKDRAVAAKALMHMAQCYESRETEETRGSGSARISATAGRPIFAGRT